MSRTKTRMRNLSLTRVHAGAGDAIAARGGCWRAPSRVRSLGSSSSQAPTNSSISTRVSRIAREKRAQARGALDPRREQSGIFAAWRNRRSSRRRERPACRCRSSRRYRRGTGPRRAGRAGRSGARPPRRERTARGSGAGRCRRSEETRRPVRAASCTPLPSSSAAARPAGRTCRGSGP